MKIVAIFHDNDIYSGATRSFLSIVKYLHNEGVCIYAVIPNKNGDLAEYLNSLGIKVVRGIYGGNTYQKSSNGIINFCRYFKGIIKLIISFIWCIYIFLHLRNKGVSWIYTNTSTLYVGAFLSDMLGVKHIWHFREFGVLDQGFSRIIPRLFVYLAKRAKKIIVISNVLKDFYKKEFDISDNVNMIYNDVMDGGEIEHEEHTGLNILITGTISIGKGQKIAIDAMKIINDNNVKLFVAGKINGYAKELIKYVEKEKIKNVKFCGFVKDMDSLRRKIDVSLVCAKSEAFGRTIIEDMASRILVIGNNSGSVPELISTNRGVIFRENDPRDLAKRLVQIKENPKDIIRFIDAAYDFSTEFKKNRCASEVYKILMQ